MKINSDLPAEDVQVQIVPLIDVIFCILTFFILAALQLTRQQAINIDLPKASTGSRQMREMIVVTISSTGQTFVDKQLIDRSQLQQRLQLYRQQRPGGLLVLNASKLAFYNDVVQILDLMRSIGGDRVALSTLPAEGNPLNVTPVPTLTPYGVAPNPSVPFNPGQTPLPAPVPGATPNVNPSAPNLFNQPLPGTSPSNTSPSGNSRQ